MRKELHTGINGKGNTTWIVVTVASNGRWLYMEYFDNEPEALCWLRWA